MSRSEETVVDRFGSELFPLKIKAYYKFIKKPQKRNLHLCIKTNKILTKLVTNSRLSRKLQEEKRQMQKKSQEEEVI